MEKRVASVLALLIAAGGCSSSRGADVEMKSASGETVTIRLPKGYPGPILAPDGTACMWPDLRFAAQEGVPAEFQSLDLITPRSVLDALEARANGKSAEETPLGRRPVVVYIHGGGFSSGSKRGGLESKVASVLGAGYLLASINYRLGPTPPRIERPVPAERSDRADRPISPEREERRKAMEATRAEREAIRATIPSFMHPAQIEDTAAAIAWLREHAPEFGGAPDGFILLGHSAGAHLAALLATDERWLARHGLGFGVIAGVVALDGAGYDLEQRSEGEEFAERKLAAVFSADRAAWADASPVNHVAAGKGIPPFLLFQAGDKEISIAAAARFSGKLAEAGVPVEVFHATHHSHGSINRDFGTPVDPVTVRFLEFANAVTAGAASSTSQRIEH